MKEAQILSDAKDDFKLQVTVKNEGSCYTKDVVQVYIKNHGTELAPPNPVLCGFQKVGLAAGEEKVVEIEISQKAFCVINHEGKSVQDGDSYTLYIGTNGVNNRSQVLQIHKK